MQNGPARQFRGWIDRRLRGCIDFAPTPCHIEILQRQAGRIDQTVTRLAGRVRTVQFQPGTYGLRRLAQMDRQICVHAGRRLGGRAAHDPIEHPGATQHWRGTVAVGGPQQHGPFAEQPPAILVLKRHAPELRSKYAGNAVLLRERLVDEGVVGVEEIQHAAILEQHAGQEEPDFSLEIAAHRGIEGPIVGLDLLQGAQVQPGEREVLDQRVGARILEHARQLGLHDRRVGESFVGCEGDQLFIGALAPQKEGQPRGQFQLVQRP